MLEEIDLYLAGELIGVIEVATEYWESYGFIDYIDLSDSSSIAQVCKLLNRIHLNAAKDVFGFPQSVDCACDYCGCIEASIGSVRQGIQYCPECLDDFGNTDDSGKPVVYRPFNYVRKTGDYLK